MYIIFTLFAIIDLIKNIFATPKHYLIPSCVKTICLGNIFSLLSKYIVFKDVAICIFGPIVISDLLQMIIIMYTYKHNPNLLIFYIIMNILKLCIMVILVLIKW